jgi:hypothetical protein
MAVPRSMIQGCEQAYGIFPKPKKAIPWAILFDLLLSLVSGMCKPKSERDADALMKRFGKRIAGGVEGCCPNNVRRKVMTIGGVDDEADQDRAFFTMVSQANHNRAAFQKAVMAD